MITMQSIFASHAVFQAGSRITLFGKAEKPAAALTAQIVNGKGDVFTDALCFPSEDGTFSVTVATPAASFEPYTIRLASGEESLVLEDILFGEVWIASGQSNMELFNFFMDDAETQFAAMKGKQIRVLDVSYSQNFPYDPDYGVAAYWRLLTDEHWEGLKNTSGAGLRFVDRLYDALNKDGAQVPVALYNASWGATSILAWIPHTEVDACPALQAALQKINALPAAETWGTWGDRNFTQTGAQYNVKVAPLRGTRARGFIWYQGENEVAGEFTHRFYALAMDCLQKAFAAEFALDPNHFMMISSLLFPWTYAASGECLMGYVNQAFVDTAVNEPERFSSVSITDLPPEWGYAFANHPIHPIHKYAVGDRLATLALRNVYHFPGQKAPAHLAAVEKRDGKLVLTFRNVGTGLRCEGRAHGLYLAGADGKYLPAEYEITAPDTMEVFCAEIAKPENVLYSMQSLEPDVNLYAGDYPVYPFHTDDESVLTVEQRVWYDTSVNSRWISQMHEEVWDMFYRPVWQPTAASCLCPDRAFRFADATSMRVLSDLPHTDPACVDFGCYIRSYPYHRLDFQNYRALRFNLFPMAAEVKLVLVTEAGETVLTPVKTADYLHGWRTFEVSFDNLPAEEILRMEFRFRNDSPMHFANIEHLRLVP